MLFPSDWGPYQPARSSSQSKTLPSARCSKQNQWGVCLGFAKAPSCILPAADARTYGADARARDGLHCTCKADQLVTHRISLQSWKIRQPILTSPDGKIPGMNG